MYIIFGDLRKTGLRWITDKIRIQTFKTCINHRIPCETFTFLPLRKTTFLLVLMNLSPRFILPFQLVTSQETITDSFSSSFVMYIMRFCLDGWWKIINMAGLLKSLFWTKFPLSVNICLQSLDHTLSIHSQWTVLSQSAFSDFF